MNKLAQIALCLSLSACLSSADPQEPYPVNVISGDCGSHKIEIIEANDDGSIPEFDGFDCLAIDENETHCQHRLNDCDIGETFETIGQDDGSSVSKLTVVIVQCEDGSSCFGSLRK